MKPPVNIRWHHAENFKSDDEDDYWLSEIGKRNWVVIGQDRKWHSIEVEAAAVKQHNIRCFYLPCADQTRWVTLCHFIRRHAKMMELAETVPGPFIYRLAKNGQFYEVPIP